MSFRTSTTTSTKLEREPNFVAFVCFVVSQNLRGVEP
jgi:hypothetical protein